jgi:predicted phage tail protein
MMRTINLHGSLKKEFGASYRFDVATAGEALRALNCAFPGRFVKALEGGSFKLVRGDKRSGMQLDLELICGFKLGSADLHIIPVARGAAASQAAKGTTKVVLGAALVGGAIFMSGGTLAAPLALMGNAAIPALGITWGNIAAVGLAVSLAGAATLMAKPAASQVNTSSATLNSGNIGNSGQQGDAIPLIYGEVLVGSTPISAASDVEDIGVYADQEGSIEATFGHSPAYWSGTS